MTIHLINAIAFGFAAMCWNRVGWHNITIALGFVVLAVLNAALAAPALTEMLK